jgi:integrase
MIAAENRFSFTVERLSKLSCPPSGRPERDGRAWFYDSKVPGLAFCVTEGGARAFYVYRRVNGKPKKIRMGDPQELNVDQARRRAGELNSQIAQGRDPGAEKKAEREKVLREATIADLWASYRDNWLADRKPATIAGFEAHYRNHISTWAKRGIGSIEPADVEKLKTKIGETSHVTANRVLAIIGAMYRRRGHAFGLPRGFTPTAGVDAYPEHARDRVLSTAELAKVMSAIDADDNDTARDYFKMLIFTGQRKNTVARMAWQDLNIDGGTWKIPGEKTKNGKPLVLTLIPEAVAIVKTRYGINPPDSPFVFASKNFTPAQVEQARKLRADGKTTRQIAATMGLSQTAIMHILSPLFVQRGITPFGGATKAWTRIVARAGIPHTTIHDIRRSFCTSLIERGIPLPIVAAALGHRSIGTTQKHYAFASDKAVAEATRASMAALLADVTKAQKTNNAAKSA